MDEITVNRLHERNDAIIRAVIRKADKVCPGALELIGITGSFQNGTFYEKSDLDLFIVIGDDSGYRLAKCFILGDVGFDIYCKTWNDLEYMAEFPHPHIKPLAECDIVYSSGNAAMERYLGLRDKLNERLSMPVDAALLSKVRVFFGDALRFLGEMQISDSYGRRKYLAAGILHSAEYVLFMLNRKYIKSGVSGTPDELCSLELLPDGFAALYHALISADTYDSVLTAAVGLTGAVGRFIDSIGKSVSKPKPDAASLYGTYEEIHSNWYNKIKRAALTGDGYLSLMTMAACQQFYDEMTQLFDTGDINMFGADFPDDISLRANCFDTAKEKWRILYDNSGISVVRYDSIDEFVNDYLK
nr:hypothetical protein [Clostridia bacterium]